MTQLPTRWSELRRFTTARVALGRVGNAIPTTAHLDFQEAHARARDAVWSALDVAALAAQLTPLGQPVLRLRSAAPDRRSYLLRPDLGRRLADAAPILQAAGSVVFVVADGLCASGVQCHAAPLLARLLPALAAAGFTPGPIVIAEQARVALGDAVAVAAGARAVVVLIGERPGLSSVDSLGAYLTWSPRLGCSDAERNCISNIRPAGLGYDAAAAKLVWLLTAARRLGASGVALKDEQPNAVTAAMPETKAVGGG